MPGYICIDKCFHNGSLYHKGDIVNFPEGTEPGGTHFELLEPANAVSEKRKAGRPSGSVTVNGRDQ